MFFATDCFLTDFWRSVTKMCQNCLRKNLFSDSFWPRVFPGDVSQLWQKSVRKVSEVIFLTYFWQFSRSQADWFLTYFQTTIHFWPISKSFLRQFWHIFVTDWFLTVNWHISDRYLTVFCNWLFSDRFLTDIWQISKSFGTYIREEYQKCYIWKKYIIQHLML